MQNLCNILDIVKTYLQLKKVYSILNPTGFFGLESIKILKRNSIIKHYVTTDRKLIAFLNMCSFLPFLSLVHVSKPSKPIYLVRKKIKLNFLNKLVVSNNRGLQTIKFSSDKQISQGGLLLFYL